MSEKVKVDILCKCGARVRLEVHESQLRENNKNLVRGVEIVSCSSCPKRALRKEKE